MPLNRLVIYAGNVEETARFYEKHFGFKATSLPGDRIVELVAQDGGANIMLHQAAKGQRGGQSIVKLVFDVDANPALCPPRLWAEDPCHYRWWMWCGCSA
ncbi:MULTISPECIES: VOC family protein [Rhizobium]|uniref:VOC family protein n=1 Tax=Rhizobium TaxID=379 RepID=UPI0017B52DBA|nr:MULTISPECIES: VOC family protein [Rhizobium]MBB3522804.1 catechol 2,3-dioxygenase-like lactoylglutathione lyase family enzyme [Rhizobium sp. BK456]MDF0658570.1 VOC family protein [Rhizobium sp. BC49]ULJ79967.1 VOC family protein [Rhizobium sp. C104]